MREGREGGTREGGEGGREERGRKRWRVREKKSASGKGRNRDEGPIKWMRRGEEG